MYEIEELGPDDDDGTITANVEDLAEMVVGHKIVSVEARDTGSRYDGFSYGESLVITLDDV